MCFRHSTSMWVCVTAWWGAEAGSNMNWLLLTVSGSRAKDKRGNTLHRLHTGLLHTWEAQECDMAQKLRRVSIANGLELQTQAWGAHSLLSRECAPQV